MNNALLLSFLLLFIINPVFDISAQSLSEQLGGVKTDFQIITLNSVDMEAKHQHLIKRARSEANYEDHIDESWGFGYGYQSIHLEFMSDKPIAGAKQYGKREQYYTIDFFDKENRLLASKRLHKEVNTLFNQAENIYSFSINLKDIPLPVLEESHTIKLVFIDISR